jgi:hypothetical protein
MAAVPFDYSEVLRVKRRLFTEEPESSVEQVRAAAPAVKVVKLPTQTTCPLKIQLLRKVFAPEKLHACSEITR